MQIWLLVADLKKILFQTANLTPVANSVDDLRTKSESATGNYHYLLRQDREVPDLSITQSLMIVLQQDTLSLLLGILASTQHPDITDFCFSRK